MKYDFIESSFLIPILIKDNNKHPENDLFFFKEAIETKQMYFSIEINPIRKIFKNVLIEGINIYHRKNISLLEINFNFSEVSKDSDLTSENILDMIYFLKENYKNQKRYSILKEQKRLTLDELVFEVLNKRSIDFEFQNSNKKIFDPHLFNIIYLIKNENSDDEKFDLISRILLEQFTEGTRQTYKRNSVEENREYREFSNILWNVNEKSCSVGVIKSDEENADFINKNFPKILKTEYKNFFIYTLFCNYELEIFDNKISELLIFDESNYIEIEKKNKSSREIILKFYEFRQRFLQKNISKNIQQQRVIDHIKLNLKIYQKVLNSEGLINTLEKTTNLLWNEIENIRLEAEIKATNKRQRIIELIAIFIGSYEAFKVIYDIIKDLMSNLLDTMFVFLITAIITVIFVFIILKTMKRALKAVDKNKEENK